MSRARRSPALEALKQALIAAVRLAQKGRGSDKDPRSPAGVQGDASGSDFIMKATEAHRDALFDLVQKAGIPVKS